MVRTLLVLLLLAGCKAAPRSKDAKLDTYQSLIEDRAATRHVSDGGGRAFLDPGSPTVAHAGEPIELRLTYEAGPLGIAEGGALYLQPSPFWGWDSPQVERKDAAGGTEVTTDAAGVQLEPKTLSGLLAITVRGKNLMPGERVRIRYRTRADRFAEKGERVWMAVDGDGDGVRALVVDSPRIDIVAGPPSRLLLTLPTTATPGDRIRLAIAALDALGNRGVSLAEPIELQAPDALGLPAAIHLPEEGVLSLETRADTPGVYRLRASTRSGLSAESNPLVVREGIPRLLWADLHGHSQLSDGTGTPEDYFAYARDVAALDAVALTDHDHWGMRFLDGNQELWNVIVGAARRFDEPGRFLALVGYEWTNWLQGHRHVVFFEGEPEILSSLDERYQNPDLLWKALRERTGSSISVAHHSAGGPVSTQWDFVPPPDLEPVTEIVSVHGSSEAGDSPGRIYDAVPGNFVRDALDRGLAFGFLGSGDSHDGHPGLVHLAGPGGGLAAIFSEETTREGVLEALRARRTYATNGPRIWLRTWLERDRVLRFAVAATAPVERVDIVRSGEVRSVPGASRRELSETLVLDSLRPGEYLYVRVIQEDGGAAWSTPFYVTSKRSPE
jgi:hypothetical protein